MCRKREGISVLSQKSGAPSNLRDSHPGQVPGELPSDPLWHIRGDDCEIIEPVQIGYVCLQGALLAAGCH